MGKHRNNRIEKDEPLSARLPDWINIVDCGAVGDGVTLCTHAIQRAIDRCGEHGGGTVLVPPGRYVTGTIWMRSNTTLHLDAGALLIADRNPASFPAGTSRWEGLGAETVYAPLIGGEGLVNIAFTGRGTIDGCGQMWWDLFEQNKLPHGRPGLLRVVDCRDVLIDGLTFINSPRWTVNPTACDNVTITRVTVRNPAHSPNTDGINPDSCTNVHISNCHIDVGDDCIAIKSGSEQDGRSRLRASQNITITNCTMLHGHGGVVIGSEMSGSVRNVSVSNCVFNGTDRGIRLKSRRGRGSVVEDIRVDNIVMDGVLCPIVVNMFYECGAPDTHLLDQTLQPVNEGTPQVRRLRFSNITATNVKYAAAYALGLPEMFLEDVAFDGVSLYLDPETTERGAPDMSPGIPRMCRSGFILGNARNVRMRGIDVRHQLGAAVDIANSADVLITGLNAKRSGGSPLVQLDGRPLEGETEFVVPNLRSDVSGINLPRGSSFAVDGKPAEQFPIVRGNVKLRTGTKRLIAEP